MGSFSRLRYVIAANVNSLLEKAEDPEKLLRALIRDMEDASEDARLASADLLAEQKHLQRLQERYEREIGEWSARAQKAVETSRDDLARTALKAKAEIEQALHSAADESRNLDARVTQLEFDMATLKSKLAEAKTKLKDIKIRNSPAAKGGPGLRPQRLSPGERKMRNAMGRFEHLQAQVDRLEARVRSYEVGGETVNAWVAEDAKGDPAIEAELEQLKNRIAPAAPEAAVKSESNTESNTET
ncbi:MAG: PspA/IM30 family protein [Lysobacterales bacterium]